MYSYRDQLDTLSKIVLRPGETKRIDCPFCGGKNSFTISRIDGRKLWSCYKASCSSKGSENVGRTVSEIAERINYRGQRLESGRSQRDIQNAIPDTLTKIRENERCERYLFQNHCLIAERTGLAHIRYSPKDDRIMFAMPNREGYVGRSLDPSVKPKWRVFGDCTGVFLCGSRPTLVLVEDAASACSVAACGDLTGGALLGTNISAHQKSIIRKFERVIVALDQDASSKAFKLKGKLQGLVPTTVRFLKQDLKYLEPDKIREIIDGP